MAANSAAHEVNHLFSLFVCQAFLGNWNGYRVNGRRDIFVWSRQKRNRCVQIERFGDRVDVVKQKVLSAGFNVSNGGSGHTDLSGKLFLGLASSLAEPSDAPTNFVVNVLAVHVQANTYKLELCQPQAQNVYTTNGINDCYVDIRLQSADHAAGAMVR